MQFVGFHTHIKNLKRIYCYMFEVSLVVALALLQQCNNTTPAQQLDGVSLLSVTQQCQQVSHARMKQR
jgi:hypothetical protein